MFGSNVLEIAIGIIFIYLLISLVCTAVNEWIASFLNQRGKNLFEGIGNLLNDPTFTGLAQLVYSHGLVEGTSQDGANPDKPNRLPSYMQPETFALVLMNILRAHGAKPTDRLKEPMEAIKAQFSAPGKAAYKAVQVKADTVTNANKTLEAALKNSPSDTQAIAAARTNLRKSHQELKKALLFARAQMPGGGGFANFLANLAARFGSSSPGQTFYDARGRVANDLLLVPELETLLEEGLAAAKGKEATVDAALENLQNAVKSLPPGHTRESLLSLLDKTSRDVALLENATTNATTKGEVFLQTFQKNLSDWYNNSMERVGGWYKRWTQKVLLCLSIAFVLLLNVDTLMLYNRLSSDKELRNSITAAAKKTVDSQTKTGNPDLVQLRETVQKEADTLQLPFGWSLDRNDPRHVPWTIPAAVEENVQSTSVAVIFLALLRGLLGGLLFKAIGLGLSAFAVSLGAPFWFDTLSKFINLRGAGTPPGGAKKSEPKSETKPAS